ncbi:FERM domain-containing protein 8 [Papilio machaon]|uniref:FERM domain-containing protein 8 n=1 Tax=Papilio machaon TaxID=76193 RepID=A0A0N1I7I0_PAPMA|nr:FERM domain-containing protein 8 [Papilio machaon]
MDHKSDMGTYGENSNVQNSGNYITIIPVEYSRRGYPIQAEYQYNEFRSREEYYSVQSQKLQAEVNAHLYSVSQRLPHLSYSPLGRHNEWDKHDTHKPLQPDSKESNSSDSLEKSVMEYYSVQSQKLQAEVNAHLYSVSQRLPHLSYSPLGRHNEWDKHDTHKPLQPDSKESNSSDSLEKSVMGSNLSSCSNQTGSSSIAAGSFSTTEPMTSGGSSSSAISPPLPGSSSSSSSVSSTQSTCIYLMSQTAIMVEMSADEVATSVTASRFLNAVLAADEMGLVQPSTRSLAANVFALWMCSPMLEVQLKPHHCPWRIWAGWQMLLRRYGYGPSSKRSRDVPILRMQRNVFFPKHLEEGIKDSKIQELLYEEARYNVVHGRYPLESAQAVMLGGIQARVQLGPYDPHSHTAKFFSAAFFQGQVEMPVRSLTSLLTYEDVPVLVAINFSGVYVIDDTESTLLLGLLYEELCWDIGLPSDESDDCLPCLFLQFMVVENGLRVSKILQVFSRQTLLMDTLIEYFASEYRKRIGYETPSERDHPNYEYHSASDTGSISLPPLSRPDSPQRRLANKLSRLSLATHDDRGHLLGGAGDWNNDLDRPRPSWILPKH